MNKNSKSVERKGGDFYASIQKKNKREIFSFSKKIFQAKNLIDKFENELNLHPILCNNLIEAILVENGKEKSLVYLDPEVYTRNFKTNEEDEDDNKIINKLFEPNVIKSSKKEFLSITSLLNLKDKPLESTIETEKIDTENDENLTKVYTKEHFKWLFKQNRKHNLYKKLEVCFSGGDKEINGKKDLNLEQKIKEFCNWAELNYDCKELELDAITLMKIFLVNYDKGPLMWTPINLEEISRKNLKINTETNFSDTDLNSHNSSLIKKSIHETKLNLINDLNKRNNLKTNLERRNNYGRWFLPKSYWSKSLLRFMGTNLEKNDIIKDKTSNKLLKSTGAKLFSDFFKKNRNGRFPYFIEQKNLFIPIS